MAKTAYQATALIGGASTALDYIDGDALFDGDFAYVFYGGTIYHYVLDDDLNEDENSPIIIRPDSNPGTKCWVLQDDGNMGQANLIKNSGFSVWSNSTLAQGTTGEQTDFEVGAAIFDEDGESADDSGNWAVSGCTFARVNSAGNGAGGSDYFYSITQTAGSSTASRTVAGFTVGKLYKVSIQMENGTGVYGTDDTLLVRNSPETVTIATTFLASQAAWSDYSVIFEATTTSHVFYVTGYNLGAGETVFVDDIKVIEVTPGCVAADTKGPDTMTKTATLDLTRHTSAVTYAKGMYGVKCTKGSDSAEYLELAGGRDDQAWWYKQFQGRTVALGCWVYSTTATDNVKLQINDSDGTTESSFVAADTLTWVEITRDIGAAVTSFNPRILFDGDTADVAYISQPTLIFGDHIGEGNYRGIPGEVIQLEAAIASYKLVGTSLSDVSATDIYIAADSSGKIGKGVCRASYRVRINDAGSAAGPAVLQLRSNSYPTDIAEIVADGIANDEIVAAQLDVSFSPTGIFEYVIDASGAGSFDITVCSAVSVKME